MQHVIRVGDVTFAEFLLRELVKQNNFGFNELHHNVLKNYKPGESLPVFKSVSVGKKANMNLNITPLHFACINPNTSVLEQVLAINSDINMVDAQMRKPIHYAAANSNP